MVVIVCCYIIVLGLVASRPYFSTFLNSKENPWSRVLLEKLAVPQLIKKFLTFYGMPRFTTTFTTGYLSPFRARSAQLTPSSPISLRPLSISFSHLHLGLTSGFLFTGFPHQNTVCISSLAHTYHVLRPSHSSWCRAKQHQSQINVSQVVSVLVSCHVGPEFKPLLRYRIMTKTGHTHLLTHPCQFIIA